MQQQPLLTLKIRLAVILMVGLYLLVSVIGFANLNISANQKKHPLKAQTADLAPKTNFTKAAAEPLKVTEAVPSAASRSGLVNEFDLLLAVPLLFLLLALFYPNFQTKQLIKQVAWRCSFLDFYRILPNGP
ncbi:hypothetical protein [Adhaeribacter rhizoryzae]|uniref:Uncharacterized protein n=1 Tax=Adhaeribacter rhizoryzae TaxID=2607907 RepID=A0A5M6D197_9BACT|nr:hypothetical protein [Adhaeribacter rhizoryzae]KAA5540806.1 hypothetical protein F0145_22125 [Adhaeribacter rhizoryzae]